MKTFSWPTVLMKVVVAAVLTSVPAKPLVETLNRSRAPVTFGDHDEPDPGPDPIPVDAPIEGRRPEWAGRKPQKKNSCHN